MKASTDDASRITLLTSRLSAATRSCCKGSAAAPEIILHRSYLAFLDDDGRWKRNKATMRRSRIYVARKVVTRTVRRWRTAPKVENTVHVCVCPLYLRHSAATFWASNKFTQWHIYIYIYIYICWFIHSLYLIYLIACLRLIARYSANCACSFLILNSACSYGYVRLHACLRSR